MVWQLARAMFTWGTSLSKICWCVGVFLGCFFLVLWWWWWALLLLFHLGFLFGFGGFCFVFVFCFCLLGFFSSQREIHGIACFCTWPCAFSWLSTLHISAITPARKIQRVLQKTYAPDILYGIHAYEALIWRSCCLHLGCLWCIFGSE